MSNQVTVSSLSQLHDALARAKGGETILLAGGDYGEFSLGRRSGYDVTFPENVTIASADPGNPAVFSGLDLRGAANLTLDGLTFDYDFQPGDPLFQRPFSVTDCDSVTIRNSTFEGDLARGISEVDDGYGAGVGLLVSGGRAIAIENNEIFDFHRGMLVFKSNDLTVSGNDVHSIRSDGMDFVQITGAVIENNYLHDFRASPKSLDHCDMIQFWTNGTDVPSTDITIRGNHLDIGEGSATQSIFMRNDMVDRGLAGSEMFYRDILIEENVIVNGHSHGITVGETAGLTIRNNSVLHGGGGAGPTAGVEIPKINLATGSTGVIVAHNATAQINGWEGQAGWRLGSNAFVQDQDSAAAGYYGDVFLTSSMGLIEGVHDFRALVGGVLDRLAAGAAPTRAAATSELDAGFHVTRDADNGARYHFEAAAILASQEAVAEGTRFLWSFGDGRSATGARVDHAFTSGGTHEVSLTLILPDGQSASRSLALDLSGPDLLSFAAGQGFTAYEYGTPVELEIAGAEAAGGLVLGQPGVTASISRAHVDDLLGRNEFAISMGLQATSTASAGEVMRLHGSFIVTVDSRGELTFTAFTTDSQTLRLATSGAALNDTAAHEIDIALDGAILSLSVDGQPLASMEMTGQLAGSGSQGLVFGNPWNKANFEGTLSRFEMSIDQGDFIEAQQIAKAELEAAAEAAAAEAAAKAEAAAAEAAAKAEAEAAAAEAEAAAKAKAEAAATEKQAPQEDEAETAAPGQIPGDGEVQQGVAGNIGMSEPGLQDVLTYRAGGPFLSHEGVDTRALDSGAATDPLGLQLGRPGVAASVARAHVDEILGQDGFAISMSIAADSPASAGELVRLHGSFLMTTTAKGEVQLRVFTTGDGEIRLTTSGAKVNDMASHDISVSLEQGTLSLAVDGAVLASAEMSSQLASSGRSNLTFGNPWNKTNFEGRLSAFEIDLIESAPAGGEAFGVYFDPAGSDDIGGYVLEHSTDRFEIQMDGAALGSYFAHL